jgi:serine/threonine protein kinase
MKTSNILLDEKFNVKVADFGISKLVKPDATHVSTAVQGTPGYLDPEYFRTFQLTDKSDVYSFGMVLLELITSLKPVDFQRGGEDVNLITMALPFIQDGDVKAIADPRLFHDNSHDDVAVQMQRVAELASKCLAESRYRRPTMKEVVAEMVAIRGDENRPGHDSSDMDHEDVEMVPVLYSQSSNITSSSDSTYTKHSKSPMALDELTSRTR